jgi:cyclopropane-fatty-acyl-phospholipid synthase
MMEHVKNYELLLRNVASWMKPGGTFFVHIFTHVHTPFHYTEGWMAENFFSGGQMPSDDLLLHFQRDVQLTGHWIVNGRHYERTCNEWLRKMDENKAAVVALLEELYGAGQGIGRYVDWRLFFIACAELFGYNGGNEWVVSHYTFRKP